ncbi:MAG TPA: pyridoxal phosphate-dependent aminotransferase family protein [Oligoflexus sp.]|uniref:aminotransferase class I/II-fold pyridoxal phosphate-dependent enzyme n=1 Tax=Oligoflexus sp. TaxID=1971216 RepID=UPI002D7F5FEC|nr:pyridoxal phosphate-dependent aminotransferase family protein [Oligoflexus sp.]HET9238602.1 pyridoxal phosphate-dependent aminotransferase family protein [Oligoflexus sp.]
MTNLANSIRHTRFRVQPGEDLTLTLQSNSGVTHRLNVHNCSLMGLGAKAEIALSSDEGFYEGGILPPAKLTWGDKTAYLGRLVLRAIRSEDDSYFYGFQTIDNKVPIDGPLSEVLSITDSAYEFELDPEKFSLASFLSSESSNVDLFARCRQFSFLYRKWKEMPKYQYYSLRQPSKGPRVLLDMPRKHGRNDYLMLCSNDYLGLSSHPKVIEATKAALDQYGFGSTGSPMTTGNTKLHDELAHELARMFGKEKALLFNSGYTANVGIITGLTAEQDLVIADVLTHASIQDGMRMSSATARFFKHNQPKHLEKMMVDERKQYVGCLVVTEGVFSMDGDIAPLDQISAVSRKHNGRLMVDEAHSFGVVGPGGLGAAARYGVLPQVDVVMGTFSKICGGIGAFAAGSAEMVDWLYHFSRPHIFSVSIPPSTAAAALAALRIFLAEKELVNNLKENISHFANGLRHLGFSINPHHESSVIPVIIGDEKKLSIMNAHLRDEGIFAVPIVYPAVSRTSCRFRFTLMAQHTRSDLDFVLTTLEAAMRKADFTPDQVALPLVA